MKPLTIVTFNQYSY